MRPSVPSLQTQVSAIQSASRSTGRPSNMIRSVVWTVARWLLTGVPSVPQSSPGSPSRWGRALVALAVASAASVYTWRFTTTVPRPFGGSDFSQQWSAARLLLAGLNPYRLIGPGLPEHWVSGYLYPLPAAFVAMPFAGLSEYAADAAWAALLVGVMALALTREGWGRLWMLASWPLLYAIQVGQWSPLFVAAALVPPLAWLAVLKPTLGLVIVVYRPTWRWLAWAAVGGALLLAASFLVLPTWLQDWRHALAMPTTPFVGGMDSADTYLAPITRPFGWLALLALLRWRRPEARLIAALACVPHTMAGYELVLLLALVPQSGREAALLTLLSWAMPVRLISEGPPATAFDFFVRAGSQSVWFVFLPAVAMVLMRPNSRVLTRPVEPDLTSVTPAAHGGPRSAPVCG